ncbi:WxL domain-containing protein [Lactiplantibacillus songbeiensis]|uniref:WxL domain-containing protein n=1 Tax=Lactiplantibacillus songbeiensis TaxID=2559920 RepID=A0ABW4C490_9LACO|nr:WxL domain-containing protein [Lactiplantibacillus songbeiensis]
MKLRSAMIVMPLLLFLAPLTANAREETANFEITGGNTYELKEVPKIDFGSQTKDSGPGTVNNLAETNLKVFSNTGKAWKVTVSEEGFQSEGRKLIGAKLGFYSNQVNSFEAIGEAYGNEVSLGGTGVNIEVMNGETGAVGTFLLPFTNDQIKLEFPDTTPAGTYTNKLTWNMTEE